MKKYIAAGLIILSLAFAANALALSAGDILADSGIVVKQSTEAGHRLNDFILRQEVAGMAIKINGQTLPSNYVCKNYFTDISNMRPNTWGCRAVEIAADFGLVSKANSTFRPEDKITKAESLAILMNAAKINTGALATTTSFTDVTVPWQISISSKALDQGIIDWGSTFSPNKDATRGEIFEMAKRIIEPTAAKDVTGEIEYGDLLEILE